MRRHKRIGPNILMKRQFSHIVTPRFVTSVTLSVKKKIPDMR